MKRRWLTWPALLALGRAAALALAACGGDDDAADTSTSGGGGSGSDDIAAVVDALGGAKDFGTPEKGGTFRIENTDFALFDAFDPTGEYFGSDWTIYSNLMLRTARLVQLLLRGGGRATTRSPTWRRRSPSRRTAARPGPSRSRTASSSVRP